MHNGRRMAEQAREQCSWAQVKCTGSAPLLPAVTGDRLCACANSEAADSMLGKASLPPTTRLSCNNRRVSRPQGLQGPARLTAWIRQMQADSSAEILKGLQLSNVHKWELSSTRGLLCHSPPVQGLLVACCGKGQTRSTGCQSPWQAEPQVTVCLLSTRSGRA